MINKIDDYYKYTIFRQDLNLALSFRVFHLPYGFFFATRFAQATNFLPALLKLKRSVNERKAIMISMTSSGKSVIEFLTKRSIIYFKQNNA